jgi:undecaprenyl-diphosphatase
MSNTIESLISWDKNLLLTLNGKHTPWLDNFMWLMSDTLMWIPFICIFLFFLFKNKQSSAFPIILVLLLLITFTDQISSGLVKPLVHRFRPTHDPIIGDLVHVVNGYRGGQYGFFSSHAANIFAVAGFSLLLVRNVYYTIFMILWATLVSYSRVYLGVHYPLDILTGAIFGFLSSILFWYLYRLFENRGKQRGSKNRHRKKGNSLFSDKEVFITLLTLTVIWITCLTASIAMV